MPVFEELICLYVCSLVKSEVLNYCFSAIYRLCVDVTYTFVLSNTKILERKLLCNIIIIAVSKYVSPTLFFLLNQFEEFLTRCTDTSARK